MPEFVTICHNGQTLTLPLQAAIAHLEQHPGDTWGACPVTVKEEGSVAGEEQPAEAETTEAVTAEEETTTEEGGG